MISLNPNPPKPDIYYEGARADIVAMLKPAPDASILEIGCSFGGTGRLALESGKCGQYHGVDINEAAAKVASQNLSSIQVGNVEEIDFSERGAPYDAIIMSEVLEHLIEPWSLVERLFPLIKPGGRFYASSPNVANLNIIRRLFRSEFEYQEVGIMDITHLRWFTHKSYRAMFEKAGYNIISCGGLGSLSKKQALFNAVTMKYVWYLFYSQLMIVAQRPAGN